MFLAEFLALAGLSFEDLVQAVRTTAAVRTSDCVFASGSLTEGLANARSDIDLYLIRRGADDEPDGQVIIIPVQSVLVDVELWDDRNVLTLVERLQQVAARPSWDPKQTIHFSVEQLRLLHRVRTGRAVHGGEQLDDLQRRIDQRTLCRLLFDRWMYTLGSLRLDIAGFLDANDPHSATLAVHAALSALAGALLAALGNSNPKEKWHHVKLRCLPTGWDDELPGGRLTPDAPTALLHLGASNTVSSPTDAADQLAGLAARIIPWAQARFERQDDPTDVSFDRPPDVYSPGPGPLCAPHSRMARATCVRHDGGAYDLFSMDGGPVFKVNELAYRAAVHFDGTRTVQDIAASLAHTTSASLSDLEASISDLEVVLLDRGLLTEAQ